MLDRQHFVEAILSKGSDTLPGLIFADSLDEQGCPEEAMLWRHGKYAFIVKANVKDCFLTSINWTVQGRFGSGTNEGTLRCGQGNPDYHGMRGGGGIDLFGGGSGSGSGNQHGGGGSRLD